MNFKCGGSYIDLVIELKTKKTRANLINKKDNKCFQYAVTPTINHEGIKGGPKRITQIKPFIDKYN